MNEEFLAFYNKADRTEEGYWNATNEKVLFLLATIYKEMCVNLEQKGVSKEDISNMNYMDVAQYWIPVFEDIDYKYNVICIGTEAAEYYRKIRKETRGKVVGGGLGLDGALKGIATAGAINMMTGVAHSAFNLVGNVKSELEKLQAINELFGHSLKEQVETVLKNTLQWAYLTELTMLMKYNVLSRKFQLFYNGKNGNEKELDVKSFKEHPFNEYLYENVIMTLGIDKEIDKLAEFTEIEIGEMKAKRKQKELEARTEDGIVFSTVAEKQAYCKERKVYKPLLEEIKQINIWSERQKFNEKVDALKQMRAPKVKQWREERDNVLKWCSEMQKDISTPNEAYLLRVMKVAGGESRDKTVVCEGHSNYNFLLRYFDNMLGFESDEKIVLFITSYGQEPRQALIFGTKHIYYIKAEQKVQFDFEQLDYIRYEIEKGKILNDKITCLEIVLLDGKVVNVTSLFASRGSSNYAISEKFVEAMRECVKNVNEKRKKEEIEKNNNIVAGTFGNIDNVTDNNAPNIKQNSNLNTKRTTLKGDLQEKYDFAVLNEEGNAGKRDIKTAIEIYGELAELGVPEAQWRLGRCYNSGDGVEKDQKKAFELFTKAANQELAEGQSALGGFYSSLFTYPTEKNDKYAVELFIKAAEKGCLSAQCNLALHYYKGLGIKEDIAQAIYWWTEAAEHGNAVAQYSLGRRYEYGEGVERSKEKALFWYDEASKQGCKDAIESAKKLREGCYITTAVCKSFGKADNCYELEMFRKFRDEWLIFQTNGKELIAEYYRTAPAIVEIIENKVDASKIYEKVWEKYLNVCLKYIEAEQFEKCRDLYIEMVHDMKSKYYEQKVISLLEQ